MKQPSDPDEDKHHDQHLRDDAEDRLTEPDRKFSDLSGKSSEEIIHELRVQQIEVEIQNEELKEAHLDLEISKDRYINLYDFAPVGYFTLNDEALIIDVNLTGAAMLGIDRRDLIHARFRTFVTVKDHDQWDRFFLTIHEHEGKSTCDLQIIRKKDTQFFGCIEGIREVMSDGSLEFRIAMSDVTSRKQEENELLRKNEELFAAYEKITAAEEELRHQYNSLAATEADLRQIKENLENLISIANVPIIVWDLSFHITRLNQAAEILIGRSADEILGEPIEILFPPDLKDRSMRLLRTTQEGVRWETVELGILHQDGTVRNVLWNSATLYTQDGVNPIATIAQGQDITDLKRLEKEKDASIAQIQKNLAQLAILNDEIRNPLTVISLYADMIGNSELSDKIIDQIHRIDLMINQIDRRWNESEKILAYLRKHYQIDIKSSYEGKSEEIWNSPFDTKSQLMEEVQAELYSILDSIDALIYVADMDTYDLLYINKRGRSLFGDITGKKCYQTIQKDQGGPCPFCTNHLLIDKSGPTGVYQGEFLNTQNGRWYDCRDRAIRWSDGRLVRLQIATDITARIKIQDAFRRSGAKLRTIIENSPDGILLTSLEFVVQYTSPQLLTMLGYDFADELISLNATEFIHPNYREKHRAYFDELLKGNRQEPSEYVIIRRDGSTFFSEINGELIREDSGTPLELLMVIRDISQRKQTEKALVESEAKYRLLSEDLKENEEKFISIFEGTPDPIVIIGSDTRIIEMNQRYKDVFGHNSTDVAYLKIDETYFDPISTQLIQPDMNEISDTIVHREEIPLFNKSEVPFIAEVAISQIHIGLETCFIIQIHDIDEIRRAQNATTKVNQKLSILSSITRHDILNRIMVTSFYCEELREAIPDEKLLKKLNIIQIVTSEIKTLIEFTGHYHDIGVNAPDWQNIELILKQPGILDLLHEDIILTSDLRDFEIYADMMFEKVIYNLIENSIRHGQNLHSIKISSHETDKVLVIWYEDDGGGIAIDEKEIVFKNGFGKNTGLGLFLIRDILSITGISIIETGTPGIGVRFEIRVPVGKYRNVQSSK